MRIAAALLAAAVTALTAVTAGCGEEVDVASPAGQITVNGNGTASAEPDLAVVIAGIDLTMDDAATAVDSAARAADSFMQAGRDFGLADEDMRTASYSLWVEEEYDPYNYVYTGDQVYHARHYVRFRVRDTERVGDLLAAVIDAGANSVSGVSFTVEDRAALEDSAYADAVRDAAGRAAMLAEAMGEELGDVQYVSQYGTAYPAGETGTDYRQGLMTGVSAPSLQGGSFRISAQVSVTWAIR